MVSDPVRMVDSSPVIHRWEDESENRQVPSGRLRMAAFNRPYGTLREGGDLVPRNQFLGYFQPSLWD